MTRNVKGENLSAANYLEIYIREMEIYFTGQITIHTNGPSSILYARHRNEFYIPQINPRIFSSQCARARTIAKKKYPQMQIVNLSFH